MVICTLLFLSLLRHNWLLFGEDPDVHASLKRVYIMGDNSTDSKSWDAFCADDSFTLTIPGTQNQTTTVVNLQDGAVLCQKHTNGELVPQLMVWILAVGLSCALLSTLLAVYLQLGNPTREMVFWIGMMPGILLFGTVSPWLRRLLPTRQQSRWSFDGVGPVSALCRTSNKLSVHVKMETTCHLVVVEDGGQQQLLRRWPVMWLIH
uniref:RxLR effector candidate protein n=1 Tax=Hyaloperonospora arabidopsidis (strain Emoy2) TaxID=559515 RepID=M4BR38_HYAAE